MAIKLPDGDEFITSAETCAIIGCHRTTLGRYLHDDEAPAGSFMLGRDRLWRKSAVYEWLVFQEETANGRGTT
jgi:predicted DNA-binding transcriptional regulator AlpA